MKRSNSFAQSMTGSRTRSAELLERARQSVAGGDSSNMRVLPYHPPLVADRGLGCRVWDVDGNEYVDLNMAYGPLLFGHRPQFLIEAVSRQLEEKGSQLGFPQELNFLVAEKIKKLFPSIELLRFANSGTEAIASAVRLARAFTGRPSIVMFEGHYHGWSDSVFHKYHAPLQDLGDGPLRPPQPGTGGMNGAPAGAYLAKWNDAHDLADVLGLLQGSVAAVLMEPVMGNAGVIAPKPGYLDAVRAITRQHGALLIFDEVITGFRVAAGGAQELHGVAPDITVLSKALGCGFPIAAFGASAETMELIASGKLFHGGVYSGNALVLSAANAVLTKILSGSEEIYAELNERSHQLVDGVDEILTRREIPHVIQNVGPMISVVLMRDAAAADLSDYRRVRKHADMERYIAFQHALMDRGVYVHPNGFEPMYLSTTHTEEVIDEVLERMDEAAETIVRG
ncbi:MAG TPA: aspartate aminotransferase family protein [Terriglobales bacterium]